MKALVLTLISIFTSISLLGQDFPDLPSGYRYLDHSTVEVTSTTNSEGDSYTVSQESLYIENKDTGVITEVYRTSYSNHEGVTHSNTHVTSYSQENIDGAYVRVRVQQDLNPNQIASFNGIMNEQLKQKINDPGLPANLRDLNIFQNILSRPAPRHDPKQIAFLQKSIVNQHRKVSASLKQQNRGRDLQNARNRQILTSVGKHKVELGKISRASRRDAGSAMAGLLGQSQLLNNVIATSLQNIDVYSSEQTSFLSIGKEAQKIQRQQLVAKNSDHWNSEDIKTLNKLVSPLLKERDQNIQALGKLVDDQGFIKANSVSSHFKSLPSNPILSHQYLQNTNELIAASSISGRIVGSQNLEALRSAALSLMQKAKEVEDTDPELAIALMEKANKLVNVSVGNGGQANLSTEFNGKEYIWRSPNEDSLSRASYDTSYATDVYFSALQESIGVQENILVPGSYDQKENYQVQIIHSALNSSAVYDAKASSWGKKVLGDLLSDSSLRPEEVISMGKTFVDVALGFVPIASAGKDVYELISGKNLVTGESLSSQERVFAAVGVLSLGNFGLIKGAAKITSGVLKVAKNQGAKWVTGAFETAGKLKNQFGTWANQSSVNGLRLIENASPGFVKNNIIRNPGTSLKLGKNLARKGELFTNSFMQYAKDYDLSVTEMGVVSEMAGGLTKFVTQSQLDTYHKPAGMITSYGGRTDGIFFLSSKEADKLVVRSVGDKGKLAEGLGLSPDYFANEKILRYDMSFQFKHSPRMPSGTEAGANQYFQSGGKTSGGYFEVVLDKVSIDDVEISEIPL